MTTNAQKTLVALAVGAMFTASGAAMATNLTWDSSYSNPTAPVDGSGVGEVWSAASGAYTAWSNGTTDVAWNNTSDSGYTAVFGADNGTAGTVPLGSNITAGGLIFNPATAGNYTISGSSSYSLTLTGASVVANTGATILANTDFTAGLNLTGNSELTLNGVNTNTVGTTIGAGSTLATRVASDPTVSGVQQISDPFGTGTITVDNGGQLMLGLNNSGEGNQTATLNNNLVLSGTANNGALVLTNNNETFNLNGTVAISGGTQVFAYGVDTNGNFNNVISGSGGITFFGVSATNASVQAFSLNSAETYTGNTTFQTYASSALATLNGGADTLPTGTTLNLYSANWNGGISAMTLNLDGNNQSLAGLYIGTLNAGGNVLIENTSSTPATLTTTVGGAGLSGSVNDSLTGGTFTIGKGVTLNASPTQTWDLVIAPTAVMNVDAGATLNAGFYSTIQGTLNVSGTATNSGEWLVSLGNGPGAININQGGVVESYLTRIGSSNSAATVNVNSGGTLAASEIHSSAGTVDSTNDFLNVNGGTLENGPYAGPDSPWITNHVTVQLLAGGATINDSGALPNDIGQNYNLVVAGQIITGVTSGTDGGLTVTGSGTVTLANTDTYTGPTTIRSGTLALGTYTYTPAGTSSSVTQTGSIADSSLVVNAGATFDISAITATPTTLNGLAAEGGTFFFGMNGNQVSSILVNNAATVTGTNTISLGISSLGTTGPAGTYTLIGDSAGGLLGTFQFANGTDTANATLGGTNYTFTLTNSNTAEMLNVSAVPEPATLGLLAIGGLALVMVKRKRKVV